MKWRNCQADKTLAKISLLKNARSARFLSVHFARRYPQKSKRRIPANDSRRQPLDPGKNLDRALDFKNALLHLLY